MLGGPDISSARLENIPSPLLNRIESPVALLVAEDEPLETGEEPAQQSAPPIPVMVKPIPSSEPTLRVFAWTSKDKTEIWRISGGKRLLTPPDPRSPYHFLVRDASGAVVSDTPAPPADLHLHHQHGAKTFAVEIAAPRAEVVQLVYRGTPCPMPQAGGAGSDCVLAERRRNAHPPTVSITEPQANATLDPEKPVTVSWKTAGLGAGAQTFADIEYSSDNGATWKAIAGNLSGNSATLPGHLFPAAKAARIRVTLNDGFNEVAALSGSFTSTGLLPAVHIISPINLFTAPWGTAVYFSGEAYDDAGNRLSPGQLSWFDGETPLTGGEVFSDSKLRAGMHTIRLVARDSAGRSAAASVVIEIIPPEDGEQKQSQPRPHPPVAASELPPGQAPAGSTILVPEQAFAGGVLTGVVLGPDDQPVPNAPVEIATGGVPGILSGEVVGDDPAQPAADKGKLGDAQPVPDNGKSGSTDAANRPNPLAGCAKQVASDAAAQSLPNAANTAGAANLKNMVQTDALGRFTLCVLPNTPKVAVNLPALPDMPAGKPIETPVINEAAIPTPQPPFPQPPDFVQPDQKFSLSGIFPKGRFEQNGKQGDVPIATAVSPDGSKAISTFKAPHDLQVGTVKWTLTSREGKQTSFTGGVFRIVSASLDRSKLRSNEGADFEYVVQASPESVPNGLCADVKLKGPVVMMQPPPAQVTLDASGQGKLSGKIRATQVASGSTVPFDIQTRFYSCGGGPH